MSAREIHAEIVKAHNTLSAQVNDTLTSNPDQDMHMPPQVGVRILEMMAKLAAEVAKIQEHPSQLGPFGG